MSRRVGAGGGFEWAESWSMPRITAFAAQRGRSVRRGQAHRSAAVALIETATEAWDIFTWRWKGRLFE